MRIELIRLRDDEYRDRIFTIVFDDEITKEGSHVFIEDNNNGRYPIYDRQSNYKYMCRIANNDYDKEKLEYYFKTIINNSNDLNIKKSLIVLNNL